MYIPKHFQETDRQRIVQFMKQYPFATIINMNGEIPIATHLPFVVHEQEDKLMLFSHFAKANEQWRLLSKTISLVIFSEPHAYISAKHYDHEQNVPTWNYIAVHAYGTARLIEDEAGKLALLEKTIMSFEAGFQLQWNSMTDKFRSGMLQGIVGFEIEVFDLQAKYKLSQNRSSAEKEKIINDLSESEDPTAKAIAGYMVK
jgi:transcriptional regulator